ncbi:hypothetical protein KP509_04G001600 [Ceratopteris richardii]|uniref:Chlorophyllase n=1 Tax=Ceratopteris richardii TaxID=49495 RepID=A0A8T2UTP3_CERRI|nr:hypothetical protein KP509_04G001600 [Ceratopteris richardii]
MRRNALKFEGVCTDDLKSIQADTYRLARRHHLSLRYSAFLKGAPSVLHHLHLCSICRDLFSFFIPCGKSLSLLCLIALLFACWETTLGLASTPSIGSHNPENVSPELDSSKHTEVGASDLPVLVFQTSRLMVCLTTQVIQPPQAHRPPASTLVVTPTATGTYPVILFKHGFSIPNCFYIQLLKMLASSGYIIVAPQYFTFDTDSTSEVEETAKMAIWIRDSLQQVLHAVKADGSIIITERCELDHGRP